jgi:hypothetical protein
MTEQDLRDYLEKHCEPYKERVFANPEFFQPYLEIKAEDWEQHMAKALSVGRVIRIWPREAYGDYKVIR